ncbi:hypothetical protein FRC11_003952 [Ceratobasidium sp. 423]|nr:hypothetical protein FRC11_003952 [Ceratobasidium sp. 423]
MDSFPHRLKDLITSTTILKVGVNITNDAKKLCRDFGSSYAARGILDLCHLARAVDVGLVGTRIEDLDSSRASSGVGIPKNLDPTQTADVPDPIIEDEISDEDNTPVPSENEPATLAKKEGTSGLVRSGRTLISFARLVRRYLARELEKGDVRMSNWERVLSPEQKRYAANDAHAGLALYHALRKVHSRAVAEGTIPVPSPPPWDNHASPNDITETFPSEPRPAPPPFRAQVTSGKASSARKFVPTSELQNLTLIQLESLIPWTSLIKDLQAELDEAKAAVLVKRKKEGVDLKGRGEAVVAAAEAAAAAKPTGTSSLAYTPVSNNDAFGKNSVPNPLGGTHYDSPQSVNTRPPPDKGTSYKNHKQAFQDKQNESLGKKWPPTRVFASRSTEAFSNDHPFITPTVSKAVFRTKPAPDSDKVDPQPQEPTRPAMPARSDGLPTPSSSTGPAAQHLRAYLLWHKQQPLSQICASMRSARYPLAKSTAISYIVQALQADENLPFEATRLKNLVALDTTNWVRETYKKFLESKIGPMEDESQ